MKRVVVESPYKATTWLGRWLNRRYARQCLRHSLMLGEAPYASHLLYTQVLNDQDITERAWGISAGLVWGFSADATAVYIDRGISGGMRQGIKSAEHQGRPVVYRTIKTPEAIPAYLNAQKSARPN